ncbi:hypothetical protein OQ279_06665 [Salinimicrobium sp. MT39]|uniref:Uncharacterized protein n=1 Tax=Salinimicrobium profundisediminis TaxID=2994553 RepID=A0A9X3I1D6_9FLAO|nr:hypothetical protein [Salinimicrobium profundisediminis]MCX2837832.1 hypothetical protein [Salinimicrobium profundisediminis]
MKLALIIFTGVTLLLSLQTCNNSQAQQDHPASAEANEKTIELAGNIREQGITSYQYGTHTITTSDDKFYALKSDAVDLDNYVEEKVTLVAQKIEGYPLSGGPDYLLVLEVK